MSPTTIRVPLKFHCVAEVRLADDDRAAYVPPPVTPGAHADNCSCRDCTLAREIAAGLYKAR